MIQRARRTTHATALALAVSLTLAGGACTSERTNAPGAAEPKPAATPVKPDLASLLPTITERSLGELVRSLPARRAGRGDAAHQQGLLDTQALLLRRVAELGYTPTQVPVPWSRRGDTDSKPWVNIIFEIPGSELPDEVLLVGAHFDAVPNAPGADDNGSGTAALLEIARVLRDASPRPRRTIRFALFNLEEVGLIGAKRYAVLLDEQARAAKDAGTAPPPRVVGMLSLEMLGYYATAAGSQRNPFAGIPGAPVIDVGDFLAVVGSSRDREFLRRIHAGMGRAVPGDPSAAKGFPTVLIDLFPSADIPILPPDLLRSDHAPFLLRGIPAAMITDTANFRNPHYHQPTDTPDTLDYPRFTAATRALAATIADLANGPGWTTAKPDAPK